MNYSRKLKELHLLQCVNRSNELLVSFVDDVYLSDHYIHFQLPNNCVEELPVSLARSPGATPRTLFCTNTGFSTTSKAPSNSKN